ncbi:MAG: alpha/beta hydrolase [Pseudomonadales bacterium]
MRIRVGELSFDAQSCGEPGAPLVLMLHGFPQTSHTWRHQLEPLAAAGYHAVAPNQRGYSADARPTNLDAYATERLVADALDMMESLGHQRAHIVGHDWGGQLSWLLAAHHPDRVESLTVLSRPHPQAFLAAMRDDPAQSERSKHHRAFQDPDSARRLLENDAGRLRRSFTDQGVDRADQDAYLHALGEEAALDAAINWYRAPVRAGSDQPLAPKNTPSVSVPTLYVWGDADSTVGRAAAEGTAAFVTGPYRFEVLPGVGHFVTDQAGERVTELLLEHLRGA